LLAPPQRDPRITAQREKVDKDALVCESDYISLHVPLTDQTKHYISAREFDMMKRTAFLINTSRGPVVDETALADALKESKIAGADLMFSRKSRKFIRGLSN